MPTHCHYYIGDMQQVCDCEPRCVPVCCDDTEERLEKTIASQSARIVELEAENAELRSRFDVELAQQVDMATRALEAERDAVRKALAPVMTWQPSAAQVHKYGGQFVLNCDEAGVLSAALLAAAREGGG